jgi:hypothetical protein
MPDRWSMFVISEIRNICGCFLDPTTQKTPQPARCPTSDMYARQAIFKNRRELAVVFRLLDLNGDGKLGQDEVKKACGMLNKNLPEGRKIDAEDLFSIMDANEDGAVSVDDFCECWRQAQ